MELLSVVNERMILCYLFPELAQGPKYLFQTSVFEKARHC
jgi:hypothetical protein